MIIILYVMDSLRPDFLSCYGYQKETSPHIDALAAEGVLFKNAFAQSTWTKPSGASLLTSAYPSVHGVLNHNDVLPVGIPVLPERLRKSGYETLALSSIGYISPDYGFGRGFDHFVQLYKEESVTKKSRVLRANNTPIPTSEDINELLFPFLQDRRGKDAFVLVWSADTHSPYFHRDEAIAKFCFPSHEIFRTNDIARMREEEGLNRFKLFYEDMIYYNDYHFGKLVDKLRELNLFDQTFFILTSDHGEAFGEHGFNGHSKEPYDELIRVPLIMKFPNSQHSRQFSSLVQHIDVTPTIMECARISGTDRWMQGKSVVPIVRDCKKANDFIMAEYQLNLRFPKYITLRTEEYKYMEIRGGKFTPHRSVFQMLSPIVRFFFKERMLFCMREDPGEKINIFKQERAIAKRLHSYVSRILEENKEISRELRREKKERLEVDKDVARQLQALGYFDD